MPPSIRAIAACTPSSSWPTPSIALAQQLFQVAGVVLTGAECFPFEEPQVEGDGGFDALEAVLTQGAVARLMASSRVRAQTTGLPTIES